MRKTVVVPLLALALTLPLAAPALAAGSPSVDRRGGHSATDDRKGSTKGRHAKPHRVRFVELGTVTAVDQAAGTLSLTTKGGSKRKLKAGSITVAVTATTAIRRNGEVAALADVVTGDRIMVEGHRTATGYVALRVRARSAKAEEALPTPAPSDSPTPVPSAT